MTLRNVSQREEAGGIVHSVVFDAGTSEVQRVREAIALIARYERLAASAAGVGGHDLAFDCAAQSNMIYVTIRQPHA